MFTVIHRFALVATAVMAFVNLAKAETIIERGKYLVEIMTCTECHTPGALLGKPDLNNPLGGSEVGYEIPGSGIFYGANLTPDKETGIGNWTEAQIITAIRTGVRPDGRILSAVMPWRDFAVLNNKDAKAIAAYLKSLKPFSRKVPGPFGPGEKATSFYYAFTIPAKK